MTRPRQEKAFDIDKYVVLKPESTEMDQLEPLGVTLSRFFGTDLGLTEGLWLKSGFRVPNMTYSLCD
ncbi:hypothetical protein [Acidithrix sp. C25]|uniref:hypothetical protein n=1 Tax=Acidithrix sp. C25 TaxID=1671482 RepID=UPI00191BBE45|nr:hypothetical protein [Acidithrix sp. C25]